MMAGAAAAQTPTSTVAPAAPATTAPAASTMAPSSAMTPATASAADVSKADKMFVTQAAQGGLAEVQLAQLAQQKSQNETVKKFAQTMIDDHTPNNEKLTQLATSKGLNPPTNPSAAQQKMMDHLQGLDGPKFDHAYLTGQVKAHDAMLKVFQREATNGHDADLKAFAESTVPTIQKHISMAQNDKM
jgi:putative membrane protein